MGNILSTPFLQYIPDNYGRKATIVVSAIFCCIAAIITAAAQNPAMFIVGRVITGFGPRLSSGGAQTLVGEIVQLGRRGFILGLFFSCYSVGSLISACVNQGAVNISSTWAWRLPALIQCVPSVLSLCFLPFVPESPRWLIANGKLDEAKETTRPTSTIRRRLQSPPKSDPRTCMGKRHTPKIHGRKFSRENRIYIASSLLRPLESCWRLWATSWLLSILAISPCHTRCCLLVGNSSSSTA
jgi:MFS family permease